MPTHINVQLTLTATTLAACAAVAVAAPPAGASGACGTWTDTTSPALADLGATACRPLNMTAVQVSNRSSSLVLRVTPTAGWATITPRLEAARWGISGIAECRTEQNSCIIGPGQTVLVRAPELPGVVWHPADAYVRIDPNALTVRNLVGREFPRIPGNGPVASGLNAASSCAEGLLYGNLLNLNTDERVKAAFFTLKDCRSTYLSSKGLWSKSAAPATESGIATLLKRVGPQFGSRLLARGR